MNYKRKKNLCLQARVLAAKLLKQYSAGQEQVIQLKQLAFSNELVTNLVQLQHMYHSMQALILACKNTDADYEQLINQHVLLAPSLNSHTVAAKALLQSAAPKKEPKKKVFYHAC